ncbi:hypothetical protein JXQ31_11205, partial [candidate division KSB1 bacterium]|nr:hypothetical protein [candidate division KSB1 bacterium]
SKFFISKNFLAIAQSQKNYLTLIRITLRLFENFHRRASRFGLSRCTRQPYSTTDNKNLHLHPQWRESP